jgi:hypothetical protein
VKVDCLSQPGGSEDISYFAEIGIADAKDSMRKGLGRLFIYVLFAAEQFGDNKPVNSV